MVKKVLITGASGLVGKYTVIPLRHAGFQIHAVSRALRTTEGALWHKADLLNALDRERLFAMVEPEFLLHLAWDTHPGRYLDDNANFTWLTASLDMIRLFHQYGGKRAVLAGTCFEYELSRRPLCETDPILPHSIYANCKNHLNQLATLFCKKNRLSYGWGRIFYVFGAGEQAGRLTPDLVRLLGRGERMVIKSGPLQRDYMYAGDVAGAFAKFLDSPVSGVVNICTGEALTIEEYCLRLARQMGREDLLVFKDETAGQPPLIVGDNRRLREEVRFLPCHDLEHGFTEILASI